MVRYLQPREKRKKSILWNMESLRGRGIEILFCRKISICIQLQSISRQTNFSSQSVSKIFCRSLSFSISFSYFFPFHFFFFFNYNCALTSATTFTYFPTFVMVLSLFISAGRLHCSKSREITKQNKRSSN